MGKWATLLLLAATSRFAFGAAASAPGYVTVARFEQILNGLRRQHDTAAARRIVSLELTERASSASLARWQAALPGKRSRAALLALVDASAFLDPPAAQMPALPPPGKPAQLQILERAFQYVRAMQPRLPNFLALRSTTHFEVTTTDQILEEQQMLQIFQLKDSKLEYKALGPVPAGQDKGIELFLVGTSEREVTYRNGEEVTNPSSGKGTDGRLRMPNMTTSGEFGTILSVVTGDAAQGKILWGHWEQGPSGTLAVFRYEVPKTMSRFALEERTGDHPEFPPYHGEIAVDPATGVLFRITIMTALPPDDPMAQSGIVVEYAPVSIGGVLYTCPVHGVAISRMNDSARTGNTESSRIEPGASINDVTFTRYHVFRSQVRILPSDVTSP